MTIEAATIIRQQWERARNAFPDKPDAFLIEVVCARAFMRDGAELFEEDVREALRLTSLTAPVNVTPPLPEVFP